MPVETILLGIASKCIRFRAGVDVGFTDSAMLETLHGKAGGTWLSVAANRAEQSALEASLPSCQVLQLGGGGEMPFDDNQFDAAVLNGRMLSQPLIREIHRVLKPSGCLFFTVEEVTRHGPDSTLSQLYNLFLRYGFDIVTTTRPAWWRFGRDGRLLTVCARKKNWREHKPLKVWS